MESDQAGVRGPEAARAEVEGSEVIVEVNMEPFTTGIAGGGSGDSNQAGSDALMTCSGRHHRVLYPGVDETVPRHVHEADKSVVKAIAGNDPAEAMTAHLV